MTTNITLEDARMIANKYSYFDNSFVNFAKTGIQTSYLIHKVHVLYNTFGENDILKRESLRKLNSFLLFENENLKIVKMVTCKTIITDSNFNEKTPLQPDTLFIYDTININDKHRLVTLDKNDSNVNYIYPSNCLFLMDNEYFDIIQNPVKEMFTYQIKNSIVHYSSLKIQFNKCPHVHANRSEIVSALEKNFPLW